MDCPSCKAPNPTGMRFCGQCAAALDPATDLVTQQVKRIIGEQFSERALIEHEVSDHLITRFGSYLKIAAWVFAPAVFLLVVVIGIVGFLGVRTYDNAVNTIQGVADLAAKSVQAKAEKAGASIESAAKITQDAVADYKAKTAGATKQLETSAKAATDLVASVRKGAEENQQKLAELSRAKAANPSLTLGQVDSSLLTPSSLYGGSTFGSTTFGGLSSITQTYKVGDTGEKVKLIQNRLSLLNCYKGEATGKFDEATSNAVIAFKKVKNPPKPTTYTLPGINGPISISNPLYMPEIYDGTVDYSVLRDLFPGGIDIVPGIAPLADTCK
jgi:putative peptidoglycan binding protein